MQKIQVRALAVGAVLSLAVLTGCGAEGKSDSASTTAKPVDTEATTTEATDTTDAPETTEATTETTEGKGSTGGSTDRDDFVDAMVASMVGDPEFPATEEQARCYSETTIDVVGVDTLVDAGYTADDFGEEAAGFEFEKITVSEKQANAIYDAFGDCGIDLEKMMQDSFAESGDMTPEQQKCFETIFAGDGLRKFFVTAMIAGDDDEASMEVMAPLMACAFMGMDAGDFSVEGD